MGLGSGLDAFPTAEVRRRTRALAIRGRALLGDVPTLDAEFAPGWRRVAWGGTLRWTLETVVACLGCGEPAQTYRLDKRGRVYSNCTACGTKVFSYTPHAACAFVGIGALLSAGELNWVELHELGRQHLTTWTPGMADVPSEVGVGSLQEVAHAL